MIKLPPGMYWVILGMLVLVTLAFAFAAVALAMQGKPIPAEISGPLAGSVTAAAAFVFTKKDTK